jgi:hypothetical protein
MKIIFKPQVSTRILGQYPDSQQVGARLCAKHQPQHVKKLCGIRNITAGWFCEAAAAGPPGGTQPRSGNSVKIRPILDWRMIPLNVELLKPTTNLMTTTPPRPNERNHISE